MKLALKYFGQIAEITSKKEAFLEIDAEKISIKEIDVLLKQQNASLQNANYHFAVNKTMVSADFFLKDGDVLALLPPFAGG